MAAPDMERRDIVGLDARAVRASVQVVSQASAADLARPGARPRLRPRARRAGGGPADRLVRAGRRAEARPGAALAPRVAVTGGGVLDEIVALLGRRPDWPGSPPALPLSHGR